MFRRRAPASGRLLSGAVDEAAMADDGAFRRAGRAGGEDDDGWVVGLYPSVQAARCSFRGDEFGDCRGAVPVPVEGDEAG